MHQVYKTKQRTKRASDEAVSDDQTSAGTSTARDASRAAQAVLDRIDEALQH